MSINGKLELGGGNLPLPLLIRFNLLHVLIANRIILFPKILNICAKTSDPYLSNEEINKTPINEIFASLLD